LAAIPWSVFVSEHDEETLAAYRGEDGFTESARVFLVDASMANESLA
jgi:hypothetical protein